MTNTLKSAYGAGWRAGMAEPRIQGMANTRGLKTIVPPLNPYDNIFAARWRPLLGMVWELGYSAGMYRRLVGK